MKNLYIIKTGSTFTNTKMQFKDFEYWIIDHLENKNVKIIDVQKGDKLPDTKDCDGIIITGSHSMVTEENIWSVKIEKWLKNIVAEDIHTLAICYGHQLLAKALDGVSDYHPKGIEIGTGIIELTDEAKEDKLFSHLPKNFYAHTIHSQSAIKLPSGAIRVASNPHDINHAFRIKNNIWGVQFHPEFDENSMASYIKEVSKNKGFDKKEEQELLNGVKATPHATSLLKRFEKLIYEG